MRDFSLYLTEFDKLIVLIVHSGRIPAESDVDLFINKMWEKPYWAYDENNFASASSFRGVQATDIFSGNKILDIENYAYTDYATEVKPMLMEKLQHSVGEVGAGPVREWETSPTPLARLAKKYAEKDGFRGWNELENLKKRNSKYWIQADAEISYIKSRLLEYNKKVLPYQLKKTMHHRLMSIGYSTSSGKCFVQHEGTPIVNSEAEIAHFIHEHAKDHRALWFSISNTGKDYKAGVADIDFHHYDATEREKKKVVKEVAKRLTAAGYPILIQYSGHGYHVWFGRGSGPAFDDRHALNNLIKRALGKVPGAVVGPTAGNKARAMADNLAIVELEERTPAMWGMFFGLHYKPHPPKSASEDDGMWSSPGSGLSRVPLSLDQLDSFDPFKDAHPERVLENFDQMTMLVDNFFDEVEIGYGHEEEGQTAAPPPCFRSEGVEPDHPLAIATTAWKKNPDFTQLRWDEALEMFSDMEDYTVAPKFNGALFAIHYKEEGGHRVGGNILTSERSIVSLSDGGATLKMPVTTLMSSKGGLLLWENHVTREFEDACKKRGISEALFVGELFQHDTFGVVRGPQAVTSVIMRNEINPKAFKQLRYALIDVVSIDNNPVDVEYRVRHGELIPFEGDKVKVIPLEHISNASGPRLEALWNLHVSENQQEGLVIYKDEERFKIKRKHTVDAVIISVATSSKPWMDGRKNRHVFEVAVAKKTKYGDPTYIFIGSVGWGPGWNNEKQSMLFDMVMGDEVSEGKWEHSINLPDVPQDDPLWFAKQDRHFVEPRIVVEIEYERLSENHNASFGTYYYQSTKRPARGQRQVRSGFRLYPQLLGTRRMLGPAIIKELRPDKDPTYTYDIRHEQADGAGGFGITRAAKSNPTAVYGYPSWMQAVAQFIPITPSTGAEMDTVLICDSTLNRKKFLLGKHGFPRDKPWLMPIEGYRKLWDLSKRSGRQKEYGGYVSDGTIYYGTSHSMDSINLWLSDDTFGADLVFHTHPKNSYDPPTYPVISGSDLATSLESIYFYGIPWEAIIAPHGFVFYRPNGIREGSKLLKEVEALKDNDSSKQIDRLLSAISAEAKKVRKSHEKATKLVNKEEENLHRERGFVSEHPSWHEDAIIDAMNADDISDIFFEYVYVPLYVLGPNFRSLRHEAIKSNPSTGYFGVKKSRPTFEGVVDDEGRSMRPMIRFDTEFAPALARGRRADPNEKGYKLYTPSPSFNINQGEGYAFVLGLPISMQLDFTDMYGGPGATGIAALSADMGNIRATTEQFNIAYRSRDPQQAKNDLKAIYSASMEMPPTENLEERTPAPTLYDDGKRKGRLAKEMESALKGAKFTGNQGEKLAHLRSLKNDLSVMTNPPTDIEEWDQRIELYRQDLLVYKETVDPEYQTWVDYASSKFSLWEIPLLEKGRLLMEAIENYTLSDEEVGRVRQEYSSMTLDLANPLGNLLSGLDSDEEEDFDEDFDEDEEDDETQ